MYEPLKFTVSKNRTTVFWTILMAIGITGYIAGFVSLFSNTRSFEEIASYFFVIGTALLVAAIFIYYNGKQELLLVKNSNGEIEISIKHKGAIEFELKSPFRRNTYVMDVPTGGKGALSTIPELFVVFLNDQDKPILTLKATPGKFADIPAEFVHVELGSFAVANMYTCRKIREFSFMLKKRESQ